LPRNLQPCPGLLPGPRGDQARPGPLLALDTLLEWAERDERDEGTVPIGWPASARADSDSASRAPRAQPPR